MQSVRLEQSKGERGGERWGGDGKVVRACGLRGGLGSTPGRREPEEPRRAEGRGGRTRLGRSQAPPGSGCGGSDVGARAGARARVETQGLVPGAVVALDCAKRGRGEGRPHRWPACSTPSRPVPSSAVARRGPGTSLWVLLGLGISAQGGGGGSQCVSGATAAPCSAAWWPRALCLGPGRSSPEPQAPPPLLGHGSPSCNAPPAPEPPPRSPLSMEQVFLGTHPGIRELWLTWPQLVSVHTVLLARGSVAPRGLLLPWRGQRRGLRTRGLHARPSRECWLGAQPCARPLGGHGEGQTLSRGPCGVGDGAPEVVPQAQGLRGGGFISYASFTGGFADLGPPSIGSCWGLPPGTGRSAEARTGGPSRDAG